MQNINHVSDDEMGWAAGKKVFSWGLLKQEHWVKANKNSSPDNLLPHSSTIFVSLGHALGLWAVPMHWTLETWCLILLLQSQSDLVLKWLIVPCPWHWWGATSNSAFSSEHLTIRRTLRCWSMSKKGNKAEEGSREVWWGTAEGSGVI